MRENYTVGMGVSGDAMSSHSSVRHRRLILASLFFWFLFSPKQIRAINSSNVVFFSNSGGTGMVGESGAKSARQQPQKELGKIFGVKVMNVE